MEELERAFSQMFVNAYREYGIVGAIVVALACLAFVVVLGLFKTVWVNRSEIKDWIVNACKTNPRLRLWTVVYAGLFIFTFFFLPSNPLIFFLLLIGGPVLLSKRIRQRLIAKKALKGFQIGLLICFTLTAGGILHDVAFPPTARCVDGSYSSSEHRRGTCSWHGGVSQWNPDPWWEAPFR